MMNQVMKIRKIVYRAVQNSNDVNCGKCDKSQRENAYTISILCLKYMRLFNGLMCKTTFSSSNTCLFQIKFYWIYANYYLEHFSCTCILLQSRGVNY